MNEDRQADREIGHGGDLRRVREMRIFDDHREHDRRQSARAEPTYEGDCRRSGMGAEERAGHRHHPHDGQAQHRVEHDVTAQVLELGTEENRPEDEERDAVERGPGLLGEEHGLGHLVSGEQTKESTSHEGGDEPGPAECVGRSVGGNHRKRRDETRQRIGNKRKRSAQDRARCDADRARSDEN